MAPSRLNHTALQAGALAPATSLGHESPTMTARAAGRGTPAAAGAQEGGAEEEGVGLAGADVERADNAVDQLVQPDAGEGRAHVLLA